MCTMTWGIKLALAAALRGRVLSQCGARSWNTGWVSGR